MEESKPRWPLLLLGLALIVGAVIVYFLIADDDPDSATDPGSTNSPSAEGSESSDPEEPSSDSPLSAPIYFVGDTPRGLGLYAELHSVASDDLLSSAVDLAVSQDPMDPDYRQPWPAGVRASAAYDGDVITVDLAANGVDLRATPAGMSEDEAKFAIEQVIFTAQGAADDGRPGVQFLIDGDRSDQVLGQPTAEPLANGPVLETLSNINVLTPGEGGVTSGSLAVQGLSNSFEANVIVTLEGDGGVVFEEGVQADGWMGEELFPFAQSFDLADVAPGTYVLSAMTDDPSGGEEGFGAFSDTKTITVE